MRSHLTYANVMATVAVFLALGGTSYAVTKGAIGTREIRDNSIRSRDVADGKLKAKDFARGQLPTGDRGPQGEPGQPGAPGRDATKLFAFIRDTGAPNTASIAYGSGVTGLTDPLAASSAYIVTFDRSLTGCIVLAVPGFGDPGASGASADYAMPIVSMSSGGANQVGILWHDETDTQVDTSFLVTAFC
jgi:hypothetical protein